MTISQEVKTVDLDKLIAPAFYELHWDIKEEKHTHYDLAGGRGSTKSSFISIEIPLGMMLDPDANAVVYRKVGDTLRDSVYEQMLWGIEALGVSHLWHANLTPLKITYIPTGQEILFRGLDKAEKSKSIKRSKGYFKYLWFEELDEFNGMEEIRKVEQSVMRGGSKFVVFRSYNPPKSINNWVNQEALIPRDDTYKHHSTYLDVPVEWLGQTFIDEAEQLKKTNPRAYEHEYLGVATGTGGQVFDNVTIREITDEEIGIFDKIKQGLDFGFAKDPLAYLKMHFNKKQMRLYIFAEIYAVKMSTDKAVTELKKLNPLNKWITADSEEPRTIATFNEKGLRVKAAKKGPGSVDHGMAFLSDDIVEIIIDPIRCPNASREFSSYELEMDKHGNFKSIYPDKDNHTIDAARYGLEDDMLQRKARIKKKSKYGLR